MVVALTAMAAIIIGERATTTVTKDRSQGKHLTPRRNCDFNLIQADRLENVSHNSVQLEGLWMVTP